MPAPLISLQPGGIGGLDGPVDDIIIPLPTGTGVLIDIDEKPHPVGARARRQRRSRRGIEINISLVSRDFKGHQIISPADIDILYSAHTLGIARERIARL